MESGLMPRPAVDAILTIFPCSCCLRYLTAVRQHKYALFRLSATTASQSRSSISSIDTGSRPLPALLTSMLTFPNSRATSWMAGSSCLLSVTSAWKYRHRRPSLDTASRVSRTESVCVASRSRIATSAPCPASASAVALPIPRAPPVTIADAPLNLGVGCALACIRKLSSHDSHVEHYAQLRD